jgi:hypothetical protein
MTNAKPVKRKNFRPKPKSEWKNQNYEIIKIKKHNSEIRTVRSLNRHKYVVLTRLITFIKEYQQQKNNDTSH